MMARIHVDNVDEDDSKTLTPSPATKVKGPLTTSTKQSTGYITVSGIESETSYQEKDWPRFSLKELMENAYDFLNDYYSSESKEARKIAIGISIELVKKPYLFRLTVRNSNTKNITVFQNLQSTFDYDIWSSSKRNQKRIVSGALGDFLKRVLGMGYATWNSSNNDPNSFIDKQWEQPLILRFNGWERKVFIVVENQQPRAHIEKPTKFDAPDYTEIEVVLPLSAYWEDDHELLLNELERIYKQSKIAKSKIEFSFIKTEAV